MKYRALIVKETADGTMEHGIDERDLSLLPEHDTLVKVQWSSLNYKDALSFSGHKGITRTFPHTPGIDAAGVVESSPRFKSGTDVLVVGYDLGMNTPGGLGEYIRVPADWVIPLPEGLSMRDAMTFGTAGFTAGQCVERLLENRLTPDAGPVVVTGATGGVGSVAVALLAGLPALALNNAFLQGLWWGAEGHPFVGTPLLFDIGVFLAVLGAVLAILLALEET